MERPRAVITSVTASILGAHASGPLVPSVTLASEPESVALESGNVTVSTAEMPEEVTIEKGSYGAASYYPMHRRSYTLRDSYRTADTRLQLPIEELGSTRTTIASGRLSGDTYALTLASDTFTDEEIERERRQ